MLNFAPTEMLQNFFYLILPPLKLNPGFATSLGNSVGFSDNWNYGDEAIFWFGFDDDIFRAGLHRVMV